MGAGGRNGLDALGRLDEFDGLGSRRGLKHGRRGEHGETNR